MRSEAAYIVRVVSIYATHWRKTQGPVPQSRSDFDLGERLAKFYRLFEEQLPIVLHHSRIAPEDIGLSATDSDRPLGAPVSSAELFLFALPFPANQVVAALDLDVESVDLNQDLTLMRTILERTADAEVRIAGRDLVAHVDELCAAGNLMERKKSPLGEAIGLPIERHQLVFIGELNETPPPTDDVIASILYGTKPPYRAEFTTLHRPHGLNQQDATYAAVSANTSLLYGHPDEVETSVFLTTVQAVGTASRFQQIWQDAYHEVKEFQIHKQQEQSGLQQRKDLELLADEMGNLELDLAFSVEAAADLGAPIPSYSVVTFHDALYDVMQIRARAHTVSQMFVRLGGSIRSELTAIESRERQDEDDRREYEEDLRRKDEDRRLRAAMAFGAASFIAIPTGFVLTFFGINSREIDQDASMWDMSHYLWVYVFAAALAVLPLAWLAWVYGRSTIRALPQVPHRRGKLPDAKT